jgi:hypothetical protein
MIIIGLVTGGIFGGVQLVENARKQTAIQDMRSIESSALTFRMTYGRLPGDLRNANTRLQNCTTLPCSRSGDGNGTIGVTDAAYFTLTPYNANTENFAFWHHLTAADLSPVKVQNISDIVGGTPKFPIGAGQYMRVSDYSDIMRVGCPRSRNEKAMLHVATPIGMQVGWIDGFEAKCGTFRDMDVKMDDGIPGEGKFRVMGCVISGSGACNQPYVVNSVLTNFWTYPLVAPIYDLQGF